MKELKDIVRRLKPLVALVRATMGICNHEWIVYPPGVCKQDKHTLYVCKYCNIYLLKNENTI